MTMAARAMVMGFVRRSERGVGILVTASRDKRYWRYGEAVAEYGQYACIRHVDRRGKAFAVR